MTIDVQEWTTVEAPESWHDDAACLSSTIDMFPELIRGPRSKSDLARVEAAKTVCAGCPVSAECGQEGVRRRERHGVRAGLLLDNEDERKHLYDRFAS